MSESGLDLAVAVQDTSLIDLPPPPPPPGTGGGLRELLRDNLFKDVKNGVLTVVFGLVLAYVLVRSLTFLFVTARWEVIVDGPLVFYMVGNDFAKTGISYEMLWAGIYVAVFATALAVGTGLPPRPPADAPRRPRRHDRRAGVRHRPHPVDDAHDHTDAPDVRGGGGGLVGSQVGRRLPPAVRRRSVWLLLALALLSFGLITGFKPSNIDDFGGLLLTVVVSVTSIALSFPIGVVMALARRSSLPLIRPLAVGYIELVRGVPLISPAVHGAVRAGLPVPPWRGRAGTDPTGDHDDHPVLGRLCGRGGARRPPVRPPRPDRSRQGTGPVAADRHRSHRPPPGPAQLDPRPDRQFISLLKDVSLLVIIGLQEMLGMVDVVLARREFTNQGYTPRPTRSWASSTGRCASRCRGQRSDSRPDSE